MPAPLCERAAEGQKSNHKANGGVNPNIMIDTFLHFCYTMSKENAVNCFGFCGQQNPADAVPNYDLSRFLTIFRAGDG